MSAIRKLPPFEQSLGAILLGAREAAMAPLRPILQNLNITERQWRVMRVINDRGVTDATALAETSLLHGPSVTRILNELEERGLVTRQADPADRRRILIALSPDGQKMVKEALRRMVRILREYSDRFGEDRLERLMTELKAMAAVIKGVE